LPWLRRTGQHASGCRIVRLYGELYLNPYLGFLCRAGYWASIAFSIGAELVASATYMTYWFPAVTRRTLGGPVFRSTLFLVNLRSVGSLRTLRVLVSMIKFATIVAFILAGAPFCSAAA
jgi:amino acid transporter, AAT family